MLVRSATVFLSNLSANLSQEGSAGTKRVPENYWKDRWDGDEWRSKDDAMFSCESKVVKSFYELGGCGKLIILAPSPPN